MDADDEGGFQDFALGVLRRRPARPLRSIRQIRVDHRRHERHRLITGQAAPGDEPREEASGRISHLTAFGTQRSIGKGQGSFDGSIVVGRGAVLSYVVESALKRLPCRGRAFNNISG